MNQKDLLKDIHGDVKDIKKDINNINVVNERQTAQLEEHMRRTKASEDRITSLEKIKWYFGGLAVIMTAVLEFLRRM